MRRRKVKKNKLGMTKNQESSDEKKQLAQSTSQEKESPSETEKFDADRRTKSMFSIFSIFQKNKGNETKNKKSEGNTNRKTTEATSSDNKKTEEVPSSDNKKTEEVPSSDNKKTEEVIVPSIAIIPSNDGAKQETNTSNLNQQLINIHAETKMKVGKLVEENKVNYNDEKIASDTEELKAQVTHLQGVIRNLQEKHSSLVESILKEHEREFSTIQDTVNKA